MTVVDRFVQAVAHGGAMGKPTLIVVHSAETPLKAGYAASIATNWFGKASSGVTTSAHFMADPGEVIRMLSDNVVAYHVGPSANGFTLGIEQAGYARFARADWTTADGLAQIGKVGALIAELADAHGIPLRWATDDQIRAAAKGAPGGVCFHDDIHRVWPSSTTHTDPIPNYPSDLLEQAWDGTVQEDDMADPAVLALLQQIARDAAETRRLSGLAAGYPGAVNDAEVRLTQFTADVKEIQRLAGLPVGWPGAVPSEAVALGKLWGGAAPEVDEQAIIAGLAPLLTARTASLSDADIKQLVKALADEQDRRERDGDPTTGPTS